MKYSTRLSDAVHILAFIALYPDCDLTSNKLAESIQTNPAYVRQLMSALRKGGLLVSVKGHPRPALAREPEKITLLDAYRAVEGNKPVTTYLPGSVGAFVLEYGFHLLVKPLYR